MGRIELPSNIETQKIFYKFSLFVFEKFFKWKINKTLKNPLCSMVKDSRKENYQSSPINDTSELPIRHRQTDGSRELGKNCGVSRLESLPNL